jgi:hypothetical protein
MHQGEAAGALEPGSMLWLLQRDFLHGQSVSELVAQALAPVDNPRHDPDIEQLNRIRKARRNVHCSWRARYQR